MKPKLVHVIGQLGRGGAERQLFCLASVLQTRGWPQSVITFHPGDWKDFLTRAGIPVHEVPPSRFRLPRFRPFRRFVAQERPRIVFCWSWSISKVLFVRWLYGVGRPRTVLSLRNDITIDSGTAQHSHIWRWLRGSLERIDCVLSNSQHNVDSLVSRGVRLRRSRVIYNIVLPRGRARPGDVVAVPRIVAAGSLKPLKAYDLLLQALASLAASGKAFELMLVGDGPELERLRRLAGELRISDRVIFRGQVDNVPELMATAQLAAHPSLSEGLSNTVLEAMAEGLPVVASAVGGIPEVISDGHNGLLVPPNAVVPLADAIGRLLDQPVLRAELGQAALKYVDERLNENTITSQYEEVLEELLGN